MLKRTSSGMALRLAGVLFVMMTALYLSSCCDSCPTLPGDPPPYKGWLYANNSTNCYLYRIDTETDSLIDSIQYEMQGNEDYEAGQVAASPDGRYLAVSYVDNLAEQYLMRIHDARTMQTIVDLPGPIIPICFLPENDILLTHKHIGLTMDMVLEFYRVPDFVKVAEDTVPNLGQCFKLDLALDQNRHLIYFWIEIKREVGESERDSMVLAAYDYREREFKQEWTIDMRLQNGEFYYVSRASLDLRRMRLYALCGSMEAVIAGYDLESREILFEKVIECIYGDIELSPDNREIYVVDPGEPGYMESPGTVFILDAETGAYTYGISLFGYLPKPFRPLYANCIRFTPTGEKAYIGSGRQDKYPGTICVINTRTHAIEKMIWPDFEHYICYMEIGPKR